MRPTTELKVIGVLLLVAIITVIWVATTSLSKPAASATAFAGADPDVDQRALLGTGGHWHGDAGAPFRLVEFVDLQCKNSWLARAEIRQFIARRPGQLRVLSYHFQATPRHVHAALLARATEAAGQQGRFWEMREKLLDRYDRFDTANVAAVRAEVLRVARELRLDLPTFRKAWDSRETERIFERDTSLASRLGFGGSPGFYFLPPSGAPIRLTNWGLMSDWLRDPAHWAAVPRR